MHELLVVIAQLMCQSIHLEQVLQPFVNTSDSSRQLPVSDSNICTPHCLRLRQVSVTENMWMGLVVKHCQTSPK